MAFWEGPILAEIRGGSPEAGEFVFLGDGKGPGPRASIDNWESARERKKREWRT